MAKYIWIRIFKSIVSIIVVVSIVIVMLFTMIPREKIFENDEGYRKLKGDQKTTYVYNKYDQLGYLDYLTLSDMCNERSENVASCMVVGSNESNEVLAYYKSKGYVIETLRSGTPYAYHDFNPLELLGHFYANLIVIDNPNAVQDENNPNLERKYYFGADTNGVPAIMCSGCKYKYQLYFDTSFPFIHQHAISLNFGQSYPTKSGTPTLDVINEGQGSQVKIEQTFETGLVQESPIIQHSCQYKVRTDHLDETRFTDHYADCKSYYSSPSMVTTSYIFGVISLVIAYVIAIPFGIFMAQKKDKAVDKIGIAIINFLIAVPSLALIFFVRQIGSNLGFPDKFPQLGFTNIKSYVIPIVVLVLLNIPGLMTWIRRYMLDQSSADYVKFAKAKGLSQNEIFIKHILKNAIIPIVNGIPSSIILCISGALITETAFAIPGMGKMLPDAISKVNNNMVITLTFIFSALSIFAVLLGDILMTWVDPRIQLAAKKGE